MIPSYGRLATAICALASTAAAVIPLEVKGKDFVNSQTNERFQIIGVDYQPGGSSGFNPGANEDPLTDPKACLRDAALMQALGINTIRVYNLAANGSHDECVSTFNAAGIYMILDVNTPQEALDNTAPWTTYTNEYYRQVFGIVNAFMNFDNVIGFFAGNEVINQDATYSAPLYVRAVIRDMKQYIAAQSKRDIPVGYSAADVRNILVDTAHYFECALDNSTDSNADMFGLNSYSWCGDANMKTSTYDQLVTDFKSATIPVFFSEYGCNKVLPRTFTEVQAIYGEDMTQDFSGGLVYQWTEDANNYGLVNIKSADSVETLVDYYNLQKQFDQLDIARLTSTNVTQDSIQPEKCDPSIIKGNFYNSWDLPTPPSEVPGWIKNGLPDAAQHQGKIDNSNLKNQTIPQTVTKYNGQKVSVQYTMLADDATNNPSGPKTTTTSSGASSTTTNAAPKDGPSMVIGGIGGLFMLAASLF
ncbi:1-3-beta-glucanosyltransferase gel2 [Penicillium riverlandense]|uniref:1-3-beta-glucanosyltransferase gel2 n=1 Tax=Penicillium riverlandense TaxID=1903569 RepID=UPI002548F78A|nr:1-3-beta-glucanosyltransferase gel2 [Penicillium riverlandense]KAJ5811286.1 1-3-beta-glucanosyltransferase gel2 [Penicillium riverlandense]